MGVYQPKSCCICFDTKNGSLILASLNLIGSILNILCAVSGHLAFTLSVLWDQATVQLPSEYQQYKDNLILSVVIAQLAWSGLMMLLSCLLIHGIRTDRPGLMLPYLAYGWTMIILNVICAAIVILLAIIYIQHPLIFIVIFMMVFTILISIQTYFVLVINAYHKQVKRSLSEDHQPLTVEFGIDNDGYKIKV